MKGKPTTGPWFVGAMNDGLFIIDRPPDHFTDNPVREGGDATVIAVITTDNGFMENARLIAAAPDLLEACRVAERILSAHHMMKNTAGAICIRCGLDEAQFNKQPRCVCIAHTEEAEMLRATIKKAAGEL